MPVFSWGSHWRLWHGYRMYLCFLHSLPIFPTDVVHIAPVPPGSRRCYRTALSLEAFFCRLCSPRKGPLCCLLEVIRCYLHIRQVFVSLWVHRWSIAVCWLKSGTMTADFSVPTVQVQGSPLPPVAKWFFILITWPGQILINRVPSYASGDENLGSTLRPNSSLSPIVLFSVVCYPVNHVPILLNEKF